MTGLTIAASIGTIILAIAAIIGGILAYKNINVLREQHRRNVFLSLMNDLLSEKARNNRNIVNMCITPEENGQYPAEIHKFRIWSLIPWGIADQIGAVDVKNAVEETVNNLDRIGFFLLRGDMKLIDEAPMQIWTITGEMWERLSAYVKKQQQNHCAWGKYFEELFNEGSKKGHFAPEKELGTKRVSGSK